MEQLIVPVVGTAIVLFVVFKVLRSVKMPELCIPIEEIRY